MATTKHYKLELATEFVEKVLRHKPRWIQLTNEDFLSRVIAAGNCDEFLAKVSHASEQVKKIQDTAASEISKVNTALGLHESAKVDTSKPGPKKGTTKVKPAPPQPQAQAAAA